MQRAKRLKMRRRARCKQQGRAEMFAIGEIDFEVPARCQRGWSIRELVGLRHESQVAYQFAAPAQIARDGHLH